MPLRLDIKKRLSVRSDRVKSVDFHTSEPWVLTGLYSGNCIIYDFSTQAIVKQVEVSQLPIRCAKFIVRKQWFVAACDDMGLHVFNYNTTEKIHHCEAHTDYIRYLSVHPGSPYVLSCSDDMSVKLWDWERGWANTTTFEGHAHYVMMAQWNPKDAHIFATASLDRTIKVWGVGGSTAAHFTLSGHERGVNCIEYAPGGEKPYLISGSDDKTVRIWDYQTKQCVQTLTGHTGNVTCATWHPSMPVILTGSEDGTARVWHSSTYRLESSLNYLLERLWSIGVVKGSNHAALAYDEGTIVIKMGSDEPVVSMHGAKVIWAKGNDIQTGNLKLAEEGEEASKVSMAVKDMGSCDIFPQTLVHHPNGRLFAVCGDGEYVVYTAQALRNKSFGQADEFVWAHDGNYAVKDSFGTIKIFHNFKEAHAFKPAFQAEELYGGRLLCVRSPEFVCFYDWNDGRLIRRIDVEATQVYWCESGDQVAIVTADCTYILQHDKNALTMEAADDEGIEAAFDMTHEVKEKILSGTWVSEAFVFISASQRLQYVVSGQVETLAHLDRPLYLLGYLPEQGKLYLVDKEINLVPYNLNLSLVEYQSAVVRQDHGNAAMHFENIPETLHTKVARFLEHQGQVAEALEITKDVEHKFELALQLDRLELAADIIRTQPFDEGGKSAKWKSLGDIALEQGDLQLAKECFTAAKDLSALFLLQTAAGDAEGLKQTADAAAASGKMNLAVTAYTLLHDCKSVIDCLIKDKRVPEAAFFARCYAPSEMSRIAQLWKEDLKSLNEQVAGAIADPATSPQLFPELDQSLAAEQVVQAQLASGGLGKAACFQRASQELHGDDQTVVAEIAQRGEAGYAQHLADVLSNPVAA